MCTWLDPGMDIRSDRKRERERGRREREKRKEDPMKKKE